MLKRVTEIFILTSFIISGIAFAETLPIPTSQQSFIYNPIISPIRDADASQARPVGVGSVAVGGDTVSLEISGQFSGPVDAYFAIFAPIIDSNNIYLLKSDNTFQPLSMGLAPWKTNVIDLNETLFGDIPVSGLPSSTYNLYLAVTPPDRLDNYYLWITSFIIPETFYVYKDYGAVENHFIPSGWMGDGDFVSAISFNDTWVSNCQSGSCIKISFNNVSGNNWAGIYWQDPKDNWGNDPKGGFNLAGCTRIDFKAKGEKGGEQIEFFAGGITGNFGDSFPKTSTGYIALTQDWQEYSIDLTGKDLSHVIGGFGWVTDRSHNSQGATFYLDEIKYECSS